METERREDGQFETKEEEGREGRTIAGGDEMIKTAVKMNVGSSAASKRSYRAQRAMKGRRRMGVTIILCEKKR